VLRVETDIYIYNPVLDWKQVILGQEQIKCNENLLVTSEKHLTLVRNVRENVGQKCAVTVMPAIQGRNRNVCQSVRHFDVPYETCVTVSMTFRCAL
jgi:hypothetical protein